jgi:hypothetical protein
MPVQQQLQVHRGIYLVLLPLWFAMYRITLGTWDRLTLHAKSFLPFKPNPLDVRSSVAMNLPSTPARSSPLMATACMLWFFAMARHVRPLFRLQVVRDRLQAVLRAEYDVDVVADVRTGIVSSLRDSIQKPHPTRHCRTGLQAVPSLRDLFLFSRIVDVVD